MADQFNVVATFDKTSYVAGDIMKLTISGDDVVTAGQITPLNVVVTITNPTDGATGTANATVNISSQVATHQSVKISSVSDGSSRVWTVDASGLFATAVA